MLLRIKEHHPTDIFLAAIPKHAGLILKQAAQLALRRSFTTSLLKALKSWVPAALMPKACFILTLMTPRARTRAPRISIRLYVKLFGSEPDMGAADSYDGVFLLSDCFEKAGLDVEAVQTCLHAVRDYHGASGVFDIDQNGDAIKTSVYQDD